ncbi:MAG: glutamyl-tRNA amidotransferase [Candidatus Thermofonsia Clade 1 bacterium]|uniref:Glutamyl-tRNA amidotransferase n=1 Tax=Candidatus Thermofonsia Clade 1 bacterium TaxID=2364210 RepID=A0A2M8PCN0_9CHLR|nr:MAG: glutamyl-tRNA amidotransferase [Candidatus Thermofonsia Clade 1 bacterium]RMF52657.1 MAG: GatB/YqeY domain-containing protein [Chloroflexota bacterium]
MNLKERLQEDLKAAMKGGDIARRDAIRLIASAIKQEEIDAQKTLTEEEVIALLMREAKKRRDSIEEAQRLGRTETAAKEQFELSVIEAYLPQQLSREELEAEIRRAIEEVGAKSAKEMGNVMKVLMPRVKGRADGKLVNEMLKTILSN